MGKIKVSVVMPSLNVADYIEECIESVLGQTLEEIELICVDAGSTDGTLEILRAYEKQYDNIRVIHSEKKSYGYQVNIGFKEARGKYVGIVETDDYIAPQMYERLFATAESYNLDFVKADFCKFNGNKINRKFYPYHIVQDGYFYNRVLWVGDELDAFNGSIFPWAGIYRTTFLRENNIKLNETPGASYQDNGLAFQVYAYGKRGFFLNESFYYLRREEQNASYYATDKVKEVFNEFNFIEDFLVASGYYQIFSPRYWKLKYQTFCWRANMVGDAHKLEFMTMFADEFRTAIQSGKADLRFFDKNERDYLFKIVASPELMCWKRYYTDDSVWQKKSARRKYHLGKKQVSICGKRILFLLHELSVSGAPLSTLSQCKILSENGAEVEVWSLKSGEEQKQFEQNNISVRVVSENEFTKTYVQEDIKGFDLAIACTVLSIPAAYEAMKLIPTIWYLRSDGYLLTHFFQHALVFRSQFERFNSILNAKYVVAVSEYCGDWVKENLNPNVTVIHNFVEDCKEQVPISHDTSVGGKIKFVALGSVEPRKGFDVLIDAFRRLPQVFQKNCEIHIAGRFLNGQEKYSENFLKAVNENPNILFHGEITDRQEVYKLISECDVVVVPSRSESCSRVVLEGAMLSKALIVTEDVGAKYLVNSGNGWVVDTGDAISLSKAMRNAIASTNRLDKMGELSRRRYLKTSTKDIHEKALINYIERVLADNVAVTSNATLYSFDVFDTLVTRKTATPDGIFYLMQEKLEGGKYESIPDYVKHNFHDLRVKAEKLARYNLSGTTFFQSVQFENTEREDITIDDIYHVFSFSGLLEQNQEDILKHLEIETEIENTIGVDVNIQKVHQLLAEGNRVVAISDMYLSSSAIRSILASVDNVFEQIPIYVSSEVGRTKATDNIYREVAKKEAVAYANWHHIGDNVNNDINEPKKLGIQCSEYSISRINAFENYILGKSINDINVQKAVASARNVKVHNDFRGPAALGVDFAFFILIPYIEFILKTASEQNIHKLFFVSRDGYVLKKLADVLINNRNLNIETQYIYGSRRAWRIFPSHTEQIDLMEIVSYSNFNHCDTLQKLADIFDIESDELLHFIHPEDIDKEILSTTDLFRITQYLNNDEDFKSELVIKDKSRRELFLAYIDQEVGKNEKNFAFVDLDGSGLTAEMMSKNISNARADNQKVKTFFYWVTNTGFDKDTCQFLSFIPDKLDRGNFIECLCRAPQSQVNGYKKVGTRIEPVFDDAQEEQTFSLDYQEYLTGALSAAEAFKSYDAIHTFSMAESALEYMTKSPDKEMLDFLGDVPFEVTGRSNSISKFAPVMSREDIFNVYFKRFIQREALEEYFPVSYIELSLMRCTNQDRALIHTYQDKVRELTQAYKLQELTDIELNNLRVQAELKVYGNTQLSYIEEQDVYEEVETDRNTIPSDYSDLQYAAYCLGEVRKSWSYKIGLAITKPIRYLRTIKNRRKKA